MNDPTYEEPDPEQQYIEEQMKRDIAEHYYRKYPHLRQPRIDPIWDLSKGDA